mmetsp:Transcript_12562/g.21813  ORF Transcript_12562/g.21813 Transcript_12562/m.21813 type:complete len:312 (-) Transcript_12562:70-1005(-)
MVHIILLLTSLGLGEALESQNGACQDVLAQSMASVDEMGLSLLQKTSDRRRSSSANQGAIETQTPGIIMWSYGRSGTESFMETLHQSSGMEYCNHCKESFNFCHQCNAPYACGKPLSREALGACAEKGNRLMHVKPEHLEFDNSSLRTPDDFFEAAQQAGFRFLVTNFRENQLARDTSSIELCADGHCVTEVVLNPKNITAEFEEQRRIFNNGVKAAKRAGFTVVSLSYQQLTHYLCASLYFVLETVRYSAHCSRQIAHKGHKKRSLADRTSKELARAITAALAPTAYAWMLDLDAEEWPAGIEPPVPIET